MQCDRLGVGDEFANGKRQGGVDHFGQSRGHVVEAAGVDPDVVSPAVNLHPRTVELRFENRRSTEFSERVGHVGGALSQHRCDRPPDLEGEFPQRGAALGQRHRGDGGQCAAEHGRPPHRRCGHAGCLGDSVGHHSGERTLAQFAGKQPAQKLLFGSGRRPEQAGKLRGAESLRPFSRGGADPVEGAVDFEYGQGRTGRWLRWGT